MKLIAPATKVELAGPKPKLTASKVSTSPNPPPTSSLSASTPGVMFASKSKNRNSLAEGEPFRLSLVVSNLTEIA